VKVLVVRRRRVLAPFAREADACALGTGTFASARAQALLACGLPAATDAALDDVVEGPALVWSDDVWVTRRALAGFLKVARAQASPVRLALPKSRMLELFLPLQDVDTKDGAAAFEVAFVPAGHKVSVRELFSLGADRWAQPAYKEILLDVPQPRHILRTHGESMKWPLTSTIAMRVRHWVHVLRAGHLAPQVALLDRASAAPIRSALRALAAARLTQAARMRALRRAFVFKGRNVTIHPTATVEASVLEDGVSVGAYAYVLNSVIGAGSVIEQRAHVSGSALGPKTFVSLNSSLSACVSFGDTDACINGVQACVFAERGGFTSFALPLDLAVTGEVCVEDDGALREVGALPCGVAFGADVFVGANVVIAAGRAVPAGIRLYADGRGVLQRVPADLAPGHYGVVDGKPVARG
jgi:hypothetical protein